MHLSSADPCAEPPNERWSCRSIAFESCAVRAHSDQRAHGRPSLPGSGTPAATDLTTYSGTIASLNSAANVSLEQAYAGTEVSVVVTTQNSFNAGELKAAFPDDFGADETARQTLQYLAGVLVGIWGYIESTTVDDWHLLDVADRAITVADDLLDMDAAWCATV